MKSTKETSTCPRHLLIIDFAFRQFVEDNMDVGTTEWEVKREKISNETIIEQSLEFVSEVEKLAKADFENIAKCTEFINRNFPHVIYSCDENGVNINNLNEEEMKICSLQPGLTFTYWLIDDQIVPTEPTRMIKENNQHLEPQPA